MSEVSSQLPADPISAVGVVTSPNKAPDGYCVVAQTTDGSDADLWKDALFKSKVNRYLCFTRKTEPDVVVDMKVTDIKEALPEGFTPVPETLDTKETAMRKRRLCVRMSPRTAAQTAVYDIQIIAKSKYHLVDYTCIGEINNLGIWYRTGDVPQHRSSQETPVAANTDVPSNTASSRRRALCGLRAVSRRREADTASQFNGHYDQIPGRDRGGISLQLHHRAEHRAVTFLHDCRREPQPRDEGITFKRMNTPTIQVILLFCIIYTEKTMVLCNILYRL
uniref:multivesicular body subunit 12B-like isoform X1 n=1 Tax=Solea senegalensis TaxID=28829 RepID=UPI001CD82BBD|nr:multivesicular body subunit 12B-like isoform X1 [Solea senegalensis]